MTETRPRTPEEIAELFDLASREEDTIETLRVQLNGCLTQLDRVAAAKQELLGLSPDQLRAALELRRVNLGGGAR